MHDGVFLVRGVASPELALTECCLPLHSIAAVDLSVLDHLQMRNVSVIITANLGGFAHVCF